MTINSILDNQIEASANSKAQPKNLLRVGITQGDTNGIGYEVIFKTFADSGILEIFTPIIYGHIKVANIHKKALGIDIRMQVINSAEDASDGQVNFVNCGDEEIPVEFGQINAEAGHAAYVALERAVADCQNGLLDALVTAPINKQSIQSGNFHFLGHTEYLQNRLGKTDDEPLMIMNGSLMRVALLTTHLPVSELAFAVTQERIEQKVRLLYETLKRDFALSAPRIAVLSLNPHAGDGGVLGHEEDDVISPTIKALADAGLPVYGPYPADGFFGAMQFRHFDSILSMYHDQGLIPFKLLSSSEGVNYTAGLPIVRTSPDHGTAFDIAGKGVADPTSFRNALYAAVDITRNRKAYDEAHKNPLPKIYQDRKERN